MKKTTLTALLLLWLQPAWADNSNSYWSVSYPPSTTPAGLQFGATYTVWIPEGVAQLRGVIVHQHGCGAGACKSGKAAAYDLHWQALARKWDCALLAPSYQQADKQDCMRWCNPANGSAMTFLRALNELGTLAGHPELEDVPWCLWGHSGGGFWANQMQIMYPDRIIAIWLRSGAMFTFWKDEAPAQPAIPDAVYQIPMMTNPGVKENGHKQFSNIWTEAISMVREYRAHGAPIGLAPDPDTDHNCGNSRYLAITFFDACLKMRLPEKIGQPLRPVKARHAWLAPLLGDIAQPAGDYTNNPAMASWLPDATIAKAWMEYVKTGIVSDRTPPPRPNNVKVAISPEHSAVLTWNAEADLESGPGGFIIERDGREVGRLPMNPGNKPEHTLFQSLSYHDTPNLPLSEMRFQDTTADISLDSHYRVIAVNGAGLCSRPATATRR